MTKEIKYLLLAYRLWYWLFKNPGAVKDVSPYWDDVKDMKGGCPLCELYSKREMGCPDCVLWRCWTGYPWDNWDDAIFEQDYYKAKISAARIASLIRKRLKKRVREWLPVGSKFMLHTDVPFKIERVTRDGFLGCNYQNWAFFKYTDIDKLEVVK